jgi:hypothetical protein
MTISARRVAAATIVVLALTTTGTTSWAAHSPTQLATTTSASGAPPFASQFTKGQVFNPYFPLRPGTRLVYTGEKDGHPSRDVFYVTRQTKIIQGVICRVVHDRLYLSGILRERTADWYAQARSGAVWYFGEATAELDRHGHVVSREGSWLAGRHGARPGVYITAHPMVGQTRAQEHFPGHAEDHFRVIGVSAAVRVPLLASNDAVLTKEWTPLEPGVVDHKYYVRDVGMVREASISGPVEIGNLVSMRHLP